MSCLPRDNQKNREREKEIEREKERVRKVMSEVGDTTPLWKKTG